MKSTRENCPRCGTVYSTEAAGALCPRCIGAFVLASAEADSEEADTALVGLRFGEFEILEELGRGAMGVVFRAKQRDLGRHVALKVVLAGQFASDSERKRFMAEAESAARLDHPNIVPIYAVGEAGDRQYYAMKLIEGSRLSDVSTTFRVPAAAASLIEKLARAIHHAHQRGVLHRDLKPANLLIDHDNEPHITDFGLARRLDDTGGLTLSGSPLGTPAYMAPEQAIGTAVPTTASDVYSLGAILYELLAGRVPFLGSSLAETLRLIAEEEAPTQPLKVLAGSRARDLATICLKCLRKEPANRYASAGDLANDLQAWLNHQPIAARPVAGLERLWLWSKRRPAIAGLSLLVILLVLVVAIGGPLVAIRLAKAQKQELAASKDARDRLFDSLMAQARASRLTLEPGRRLASLTAVRSAAKIRITPELRDEALAQLVLFDRTPATNLFKYYYWGSHDARSPAWDLRARMEKDGGITVTELASKRTIQKWSPAATNEYATPQLFSPDAHWLVIHHSKGGFSLLNVREPGKRIQFNEGWFGAFTADSRRFTALLDESEMRVYDLETEQVLAARKHPHRIRAESSFHPDPEVPLVALLDEAHLVLWDWRRNAEVQSFDLDAVAWNVSWVGDQIAVGLADGGVKIWDFRSHRSQQLAGHHAPVHQLAFSPDGELLATSSHDGTANWWSARSGMQLLREKTYHPEAFKSDGLAASLNNFGSAAEAALVRPANYRSLKGRGEKVAFSPDGRWIVAVNPYQLAVYDLAFGECVFSSELRDLRGAQFTPDGLHMLLTFTRRVVLLEILPREFGFELTNPKTLYQAEGADLAGASLSQDGKKVAIASGDKGLITLELAEPGKQQSFSGGVLPRSPRISPNGAWLATGTFHGRGAQVWSTTNADNGKLLHTGNCSVDFSPDGKMLYSAANDRLRVYETGSWKLLFETGTDAATSLPNHADWSPDGGLLAFVYKRSEVVLLNTRNWQIEGRLTCPDVHPLDKVEFHPGGHSLVTLTTDDRMDVWNLAGLRSELAQLEIPWNIPLAASPLPAPVESLARVKPLARQVAIPERMSPPPGYPARSPTTPKQSLDLTGFYNAGLDEDWHFTGDSSSSLATLGSGLRKLGKISFDVRGIIQLAGRSLTFQGSPYPREVKAVPVRQKVAGLHFLMACSHGSSGQVGESIGRIHLHGKTGLIGEQALVLGENIGDWWGGSAGVANRPAWLSTTLGGQPIRLFDVVWRNPSPDVEIESFDFVSEMRMPSPFLLGVTCE